ncbi:hypothetical protein MBANPS3_009679 [Mucor bainieri]
MQATSLDALLLGALAPNVPSLGSSNRDAASPRKRRYIDEATSDEVDALFNAILNFDEGEELGVVYLRDQASQGWRHPKAHYIIDSNLNVSEEFFEYQCAAKDRIETQGLPRQYSPSLRQHFTMQELKKVEDNYKKSLLGDDDISLDEDLLASTVSIIKKLIKSGNRVQAVKSLSLLLPCNDQPSTRIICMLIDLVLSLPANKIESPSGEINLCVEYLDPIMRHIFNDDEQEVQLQWPNKLLDDTTDKRPDATAFQMDQDSYQFPVAFGEAKLPSALRCSRKTQSTITTSPL